MPLDEPPNSPSGLVQSYILTNGRFKPSVDKIDLLTIVAGVGNEPVPAMEPEYCSIIRICNQGRLSVVEISSMLQMPPGIVTILVSDLISSRYLIMISEVPPAELPEQSLLEEVLHGLRRQLKQEDVSR